MNDKPTASISEHFASLQDPRIDRTKLHQLLDILVIAICAIICGADDWVEVELFGNAKLAWLRTFLELPHGIPSHDTFGRVFARLDAEQFQQCFLAWIQAVSEITRGQVIAIDGKVLRGSCNRLLGKAGIDMVSAWATANHLVLGQVKVDDKSNEITAIPKLLQVLEIAGCIVTIDAIGCQLEIAQAIVDQEADYVLVVKENQGHLYEDIQGLFDAAQEVNFKDVPHDYYKTTDKSHGRLEIRQCWTISDDALVNYLRNRAGWRNLRTIVKVVAERRVNGETTLEPVTSSPAWMAMPDACSKPCAAIGASKTRCTGCWTSPLMKTISGSARTMARPTLRSSDILRSICSNRKRPSRPASRPSV